MEIVPSSASTTSAQELYQQGCCCLEKKEYDEAIVLFKQAVELDKNHIPALGDLAWTLLISGRVPLALAVYKQVERVARDNPRVLNGIALCFQGKGDFAKAVAYYRKASKLAPNDVCILYNIVLLEKPHPNTALAKQLQAFYDSKECIGESRIYVCFALAKIYENHGDPLRSFRYYAEANRLQHLLTPYEEASQLAVFDAIETTFTAPLLARLTTSACQDASPIFVLGMPRSGTSLVEQILASHSSVYGAGEIDVIPHVAEKLIPHLIGERFPQAVQRMDSKAVSQLAGHTLQRLRSYCPDNNTRIVDKTPNNFFLIGLIKILFPRATIIHCVRDPMDNCWSLFRQHFTGIHPYCYDQTTLGRYYCRYQKLMRHWFNVLPGAILDVQYETLVSQPESTIRAIIEHCRLPWENRCLAFYRTKRVVTTASFRQVRRPIYSNSVKSWGPVADKLAPLSTALRGSAKTSGNP